MVCDGVLPVNEKEGPAVCFSTAGPLICMKCEVQMVEYSFLQLMGVCCTIMDFCEKQGFSDDELDRLFVCLSDPKEDGTISFDLGFSKSGLVSMS